MQYFTLKYRDENEQDKELKFSDFNSLCSFVDEVKSNKKYSKKLALNYVDHEFFVSLVSTETPQMSTGLRYSFNCKFRDFSDVVFKILDDRIKFASLYEDDVEAQFEYWTRSMIKTSQKVAR